MAYSQALEEQIRRLRMVGDVGFSTGDGGDGLRAILAESLSTKDTYYWSPEICDLIQHAAVTMGNGWVYATERLITPGGFAWLSRPLSLKTERGSVTLHALCWRSMAVSPTQGQRTREHEVVVFGFGSGTVFSHDENIMPGMVRHGQSIQDSLDQRDHNVARSPAPGDNDDSRAINVLTMTAFAACMSFLEQSILTSTHQQAERHVRRRVVRQGWEHPTLIRVVALRRRHAASQQRNDHGGGEWSYRWVVSGHWRQQPYPSLGIRQPIWIMPYTKGPEDRPLKIVPSKVFAVIR